MELTIGYCIISTVLTSKDAFSISNGVKQGGITLDKVTTHTFICYRVAYHQFYHF